MNAPVSDAQLVDYDYDLDLEENDDQEEIDTVFQEYELQGHGTVLVFYS
jgi:hypothetical protein